MNETRNSPDSDLDKLSRLKALSWLSTSEIGLLAGSLVFVDYRRSQVIRREDPLVSKAHILLKGIARITCQSARGERVTIALLPPGPIPEFPSLPYSRFDFRCEAYNDCRVGSLGWSDFERIAAHRSESVFKTFHANDLQQWYRLLRGFFSHQDLADLVGASRPRVTEHLAQLEREHMVIRQGRQLIVCVDKIRDPSGGPLPLLATNDHVSAGLAS